MSAALDVLVVMISVPIALAIVFAFSVLMSIPVTRAVLSIIMVAGALVAIHVTGQPTSPTAQYWIGIALAVILFGGVGSAVAELWPSSKPTRDEEVSES